MNTLDQLLKDWHDPLSMHDVQDAEEIIHMLEIELAGKESVIKALHNDIGYYRKDKRDQYIQDQGLCHE